MKKPTYHDTESRGRMSVAQIAEAAGLPEATVSRRLATGIRGEKLFARDLRKDSRRDYAEPDYRDQPGQDKALLIACKIARCFNDGAPSVEYLRSRFGMSRPTAYRWRQAWIDSAAVAR